MCSFPSKYFFSFGCITCTIGLNKNVHVTSVHTQLGFESHRLPAFTNDVHVWIELGDLQDPRQCVDTELHRHIIFPGIKCPE